MCSDDWFIRDIVKEDALAYANAIASEIVDCKYDIVDRNVLFKVINQFLPSYTTYTGEEVEYLLDVIFVEYWTVYYERRGLLERTDTGIQITALGMLSDWKED